MKDLFFDTETTGKWNFRNDYYGAGQPGLVQLAARLFDTRKLVAEINLIVIPLDVQKNRIIMENEVMHGNGGDFSGHGITNEMVDAFGVPYQVALGLFNNLLKRADRVRAFNAEFDLHVMGCAYSRIAAPQDVLKSIPAVCDMLSAAEPVGEPGRFGDKFGWPSLMRAYKKLVHPDGFEGAHSAMADVQALHDVAWKREDLGFPDLPPKKRP